MANKQDLITFLRQQKLPITEQVLSAAANFAATIKLTPAMLSSMSLDMLLDELDLHNKGIAECLELMEVVKGLEQKRGRAGKRRHVEDYREDASVRPFIDACMTNRLELTLLEYNEQMNQISTAQPTDARLGGKSSDGGGSGVPAVEPRYFKTVTIQQSAAPGGSAGAGPSVVFPCARIALSSVLLRRADEDVLAIAMHELLNDGPEIPAFIAVTGTAGIGKSIMGCLFLWRTLQLRGNPHPKPCGVCSKTHELHADTTVVYQDCKVYYVIQPDGSVAFHEAMPRKILSESATVHIRDPRAELLEEPPMKCRTIFFMPPNRQHLKSCLPVLLVAPPWEYWELECARQLYYNDRVNPEQLKSAFSHWGGVPRLVLEDVMIRGLDSVLYQFTSAVEGLRDFDAVLAAVQSGVWRKDSCGPHVLLHMLPMEGYTDFRLCLCSPRARDSVIRLRTKAERDRIEAWLATTQGKVFDGVRGQIFEAFCHSAGCSANAGVNGNA